MILPSKNLSKISALTLGGGHCLSEPVNWIYEKLENTLIAVRDHFPSLRSLRLGIGSGVSGTLNDDVLDQVPSMEEAFCSIDSTLSRYRKEIEIEIFVYKDLFEEYLFKRADNDLDTLYSRIDGSERLWREGREGAGLLVSIFDCPSYR